MSSSANISRRNLIISGVAVAGATMQSEANAQGLGEVGLGVNKPREFVLDRR